MDNSFSKLIIVKIILVTTATGSYEIGSSKIRYGFNRIDLIITSYTLFKNN